MEEQSRRLTAFKEAKRICLAREDLSRKGSIDEPIRPLVELLNASLNYYTTSTCSGRISLIRKPRDNAAIKKGGDFVLNSHDVIGFELFESLLNEHVLCDAAGQDCLWLKFEPFILHIQCLDLHSAHSLLTVALAAGCRNSGLTLGKNEKYLVAIRSTSSMEVPLHCGDLFERLGDDYMKFLCNQCNLRLRDNFVRLERFQTLVEPILKDPSQNVVAQE